MRKMISFLLTCACVLSLAPGAKAWEPDDVRAQSAILIHESGQIIYEKDADARMLIASTTKLMTALVALEHGSKDQLFTAEPQACGVEGSSMYLVPGERYSLEELLEGLLLASGNDAALTLAQGLAGSVETFSDWMNDTARRLGMEQSHFSNPHGLDAPDHYSSAGDLAKLMFACLENQTLAHILGMKTATVRGQSYQNHNKLLWSCPGCIAGKTGYTQAAGRCLVSCCERGGLRFVCVTLNDPSDWEDHIRLYEDAFSRFSVRDVTEGLRFSVPVITGERDTAFVRPEALELFLARDTTIRLEADLPWFVFAPVRQGEQLGTLRAYEGECLLGEVTIRCEQDIPAQLWKTKQEEPDGRTFAEADLRGGNDVPARGGGSHTVRESHRERPSGSAGGESGSGEG